MKRMLINATQAEEVRVALVDGQQLYDLDIESKQRDRLKDNIYKGRVARVEPSLQAAFVEIGEGRQAFLPLKSVAPQYMKADDLELDQEKRNINSILQSGQEVIVQVEKEARGSKGAAVTSYVSVAGRYVVLMPNNPRAGGVSRRIEGEEREVTRELLSQLELPNGMGIIIRTGGVGRSVEELQWDLDHLLKLWESISEAAASREAPALLFRDSDLMSRAIRDYLSRDIGEILVDEEDAYDAAREFVAQYSPSLEQKVKRYDQKVPLFSAYQIESQIESAYRHRVSLPSGGSVIIERTEALVAVDVNSGRSTSGADIEETALSTNLEAVTEVARQLRLRDIGGLVVLDLIDMGPMRNRRQVEQAMEEALEKDRARTQVQRISRFGLLEMTRERLGASLEETSTQLCPRCSGQGRIRDIPSTALSILRLSEEEALKRESRVVRARVPLEVASFLLNEKRGDLAEIEQRTSTHLVIVPTPHFDTPHFEIERIRETDAHKGEDLLSYQLMDPPPPPASGTAGDRRDRRSGEPAVVAGQRSPSPPPAREKKTPKANGPGILSAIRTSLSTIFAGPEEKEEAPEPAQKQKRSPSRQRRGGQARGGQAQDGRTRKKDKADSDKSQAKSRNGRQRGKGKEQQKGKGEKSDKSRDASARGRRARPPRARPAQAEIAEEPAAASAAQPTQSFTPPAEGETKRRPKRTQAEGKGKPEETPKARAKAPAKTQESKPASAPANETKNAPDAVTLDIETVETEIATKTDASASDAKAPAEAPAKAAVAAPAESEPASEEKPVRPKPQRRPQVKTSTPPSSFEVETLEVSAPDAPADSRGAPAKSASRPAARPANDPRAAPQADKVPEFEIEEA